MTPTVSRAQGFDLNSFLPKTVSPPFALYPSMGYMVCYARVESLSLQLVLQYRGGGGTILQSFAGRMSAKELH